MGFSGDNTNIKPLFHHSPSRPYPSFLSTVVSPSFYLSPYRTPSSLFTPSLSFYPHPLHLRPLPVSAARMGDLVSPVSTAAVPPLQAHQPSSMGPSVASELARICVGLGMAPPDFTFIRSRQVRHTHMHEAGTHRLWAHPLATSLQYLSVSQLFSV